MVISISPHVEIVVVHSSRNGGPVGKGDKRRVVKLPVDVFRSIEQYIWAAGRANKAPESALFTGFFKGDKPTEQPISDKLIERVVKHYSQQIDILPLTPHGLRSTFITLALENKATLHLVQYAAGHADLWTTERYQKRKLNRGGVKVATTCRKVRRQEVPLCSMVLELGHFLTVSARSHPHIRSLF